jgi:hypothetical protein
MGMVRARPDSALAARCHLAWVEVEQDCEAFIPRPANVNAGARESLVTEGAWCPFCAATIKRKIPYNGKTSYNRKRKRAQDTLSLPHVRNLPVNSQIAGAHSGTEPGLNGHRGRTSAVGLIHPKFPHSVGAAVRRLRRARVADAVA